MTSPKENPLSPPSRRTFLLQKGSTEWAAQILSKPDVSTLTIWCVTPESSTDAHFLGWSEKILHRLLKSGSVRIDVVTHYGPDEVRKRSYQFQGPSGPENTTQK